MEASPLTQQSRPEVFQPKIVKLYEALFQVSLLAWKFGELLLSLG
jgi:hypothetical protein